MNGEGCYWRYNVNFRKFSVKGIEREGFFGIARMFDI